MNKNPKIAIIGYGKMGKAIEKSAVKHNIEITDIFDIDTPIQGDKNYEFDVAIDFSLPNSVIENCRLVAQMQKNIVIGTTGWYNKTEELKAIIDRQQVGCIYASNFSIGMNIFLKIVENASKLINKYNDFDVMVSEIHHKNKIDHPSGTALTISNLILQNMERKQSIISDLSTEEAIKPENLNVSYSRVGSVVGNHSVTVDGEYDTITLNHNAKSRDAFAEGAVYAAKWINNKKGFYNFFDIV